MTNYDGGKTLSVKGAIDLLNPIVKAPGQAQTKTFLLKMITPN